MSQLFTLRLATETLSADAEQIGVCIEELQNIRISVKASLVLSERKLWLSYQIHLPSAMLAAKLDWPVWQQSRVCFTDYLWQRTCLECFVSSKVADETTNYIEINASPNGQYALYKFDDYRTPSTYPPLPLSQADGTTKAKITWAKSLSNQQVEQVNSLKPHPILANHSVDLSSTRFTSKYQYQRCFGVSLDQLSLDSDNCYLSDDTGIKLIHPCVILQFCETNLYFASAHATPPDFHQRRYWTPLDLQAALTK
ncbi:MULTISPECIES: hypothetical protein [unclassified Psychrobacter]|uniref:hypothetical protein n=1 Tax=unclassified Psychrobacter TaxID=196806 RepID=UPI00071E8D5D|nr:MULTISPECIES: hypothetical protein [unclassified Psychrobacter]OLF39022.1 hypothetical protein BTV98_00945 [Psychrobacter sp. Cmf 22.2]